MGDCPTYPIVWTDVHTAYGTSAAADQPLAVFGALSYWWMGEHGHPRLDTSEHIYFANDQLGVSCVTGSIVPEFPPNEV